MFGKGVGIIIDKPAPFPNIAQLSTIYHSKCRMSLTYFVTIISNDAVF